MMRVTMMGKLTGTTRETVTACMWCETMTEKRKGCWHGPMKKQVLGIPTEIQKERTKEKPWFR